MVEHVEFHCVGEEADIVDDNPVDIGGGSGFAVACAVRNTNLFTVSAKVSLGLVEFRGARRRCGQANHEVDWIGAKVRQSIRGRIRGLVKRQVCINSYPVLAAWPTEAGEEVLADWHLNGLGKIEVYELTSLRNTEGLRRQACAVQVRRNKVCLRSPRL